MKFLKNILKTFQKKISLAVIFVEYDRKRGKADGIFKLLQNYLANIKGCQVTYLRIDNAKENNTITQDGNIYTVSGNNTFREFSGWQRGLEAISSLNIQCDIVLITNEMFLKPGPSFLQDYSTRETLENCYKNNRIIGRIDTANQHYTVFGYDVSKWICTNAFFVPKSALDELDSVVLINDNIHNIIPPAYNNNHLQQQLYLTAANNEDQSFAVELELADNFPKEIRFSLETITQAKESTPDDDKLGLVITEISYNDTPCPDNTFIRGIHPHPSKNKTASAFLLSLPKEPGKLHLKGFIPPGICDKLGRDKLRISVYNDSFLYQKDAPINITYQRWLVEWLTERWHSKFAINADTWDLFRTKASAIINESLLTAKFSELGYNPESYGNKKYY